jgi:tetratricopeptide (TPR) repeat protein
MERAHKVHPEGYFCFTPVPYESCKMSERYAYSVPLVPIWLARARAGAGDVSAGCDEYASAMIYFYMKDHLLVRLGQEFERLTGQRLAGNPQDGQQYKLAVLRFIAEKKGWHWARIFIIEDGLQGTIPIKDCLKFADMQLKNNPEDVDFKVLKAFLLLKEGMVKEALPLAKEVTEKDPGNQVARTALGTALLETGDIEGALPQLRLGNKGRSDEWTDWRRWYYHHYRQLSIVSLLDILAKQTRETAVKSHADTSKR